ncbi:MAG: heterodisulfide reductase, subunit B [Deltaproteobacteria bacterium]|nr:heterodisulfide reductase, subunit B [Deltaproteobacteria bacterium]
MSEIVAYYPGCTLKTKARALEVAGLGSLDALGVRVVELERWNCCGAVFPLAQDDLLHLLAPVRDLIRAKDAGAGTLTTLCSQCYNTLARANRLVREDGEKRRTLNAFMTEETDYHGEVEVVHFLDLLRREIGWERLRARVPRPLVGLKLAAFHGCALLRPAEVAIGGQGGGPAVLRELCAALGDGVVSYAAETECCGSYQGVANPPAVLGQSARVLGSARSAGADALVVSCPLCDYNLGRGAAGAGAAPIPVYYFTQLLALALGLGPESCGFELGPDPRRTLLERRELVRPAAA